MNLTLALAPSPVLNLSTACAGPDGCSEEFVGGMPMYGGFELDVFQSLVDFFRSLPEPLVSSGLYELFMAMISKCLLLKFVTLFTKK